MKLNELIKTDGAVTTPKRKGRGIGSGLGKTSGRGHKGQRARSGGLSRPGFEGGQMPLYRRIPKRGFNNKRFATVYIEVPLSRLNRFDDNSVVGPDDFVAAGIISPDRRAAGVKILGTGELERSLTVRAQRFTAGAKAKIEAAGGKAEEI